jgi:hypothetical protein
LISIKGGRGGGGGIFGLVEAPAARKALFQCFIISSALSPKEAIVVNFHCLSSSGIKSLLGKRWQ